MIVLITPTGSRKDQFELCIRWMKNQNYKGDVLWIIVDDALPVTTNLVTPDFRENWTIEKIYPKPHWTGQNTQSRNIKAGLDAMKKAVKLENVKGIFIIEDDDYYKPEYLTRMMEIKGESWVWGETNTIYYNVVHRKYIDNCNKQHASLFQTAFTPKALACFEENLHHKFIDAGFWKTAQNKLLFFDNYLAVGIKGMPGRGGIGAGHQWVKSLQNDLDMRFLTKIIGVEDRKLYQVYYGNYEMENKKVYEKYYRDNRNSGQPQHDILSKKRH